MNIVLSLPLSGLARTRCLIAYLSIILLLMMVSIALASGQPPQVLYTDILSGPNQGGENNKGAYLSIFGKHFGDSLEDVQVFIGGVEVDNYRYLGPSKGRFDIQQITVQIGSLGNPQPGVDLPIQVSVNGLASNIDQSFMVQPGNIYFVSLDGDDATGEVNNINKPFRYVQNQVYYEGVLWLMQPGDFLVMRGGTYRDIGHNNRFVRFRYIGGTAPTGELGQGPLTITAYPGEQVLIRPQSNTSGGFHGVGGSRNSEEEACWITIVNLNIEGGDETVNDGPINLQTQSQNWRIVNNQLFNWDAQSSDGNGFYQARAGGISGNGSSIAILGNHIHGIGGGTLNHGIYLDTGAKDVEIGYNHIHHITGGNIIQTYDNLGMANLYNITVHHNWLHDGTRYGLNIGTNTRSLYAWNNVISNTAFSGIRNTSTMTDEIIVFNNTFYNTSFHQDLGHFQIGAHHTGNFQFLNNIVVSEQSEGEYINYEATSSNVSGYTFNNNVWFGLSQGAPVEDINAINQAPLFVNAQAFDFSLGTNSPAINAGLSWAGIQSVISGEIFRFPHFTDANLAPRDEWVDIGAYETTDVTSPNPGDRFQLVVNQGSGSGTYPVGTLVDVAAPATRNGQKFARWVGDTELLHDASQVATQLSMPAYNVSLTATYRDAGPAMQSDLKLFVYPQGYTEQSTDRIYHYRAYLQNSGGSDTADNAVVRVQLPIGIVFADSNGPCVFETENREIQCRYDILYPGYNQVIDINLIVSGNGDYPLNFSVQSDSDDPNPGNNSVALVTEVVGMITLEADLKMYLYNQGADDAEPNNLSYRGYLQNPGPDSVDNVWVTIAIPAGMTFSKASAACQVANAAARCDMGKHLKGYTKVLDFTLEARQSGTFKVDAHVESASIIDPNPENNSGSVVSVR